MTKDRDYMSIALGEARKSAPEDDRVHPSVGAVAVKDGEIIGKAHRGEKRRGAHAEYGLMELKLSDAALAGATVYTTLEPCTTRNHPKIPCADRLIERRVERVVIGMLDPDPRVHGAGQMKLRDAGITIGVFDPDLASEIEELNRDFIRYCRRPDAPVPLDPTVVEALSHRSLDEWYRAINKIYWNRNFDRPAASVFSHLVEVIGSLSVLASEKPMKAIDPSQYTAKAIAWWLALCGRLGVKSVEAMLFTKFPYVCPYCRQCAHEPDPCIEAKARQAGPDWRALSQLAESNSERRPADIGAWQVMFNDIYPAAHAAGYSHAFARLTEELGELAEAVRVFRAAPGYFLSEAADVFAWLMHLQNLAHRKEHVPPADRGKSLRLELSSSYPDRCLYCGGSVCVCPPIRPETVGRIGHEVPQPGSLPVAKSSFLSPEDLMSAFQLG